jgi:hypothetical protein
VRKILQEEKFRGTIEPHVITGELSPERVNGENSSENRRLFATLTFSLQFVTHEKLGGIDVALGKERRFPRRYPNAQRLVVFAMRANRLLN